jgi:hypothetical protein
MTRHILLFALLLTASYGFSQSDLFGISKSELINIKGAPDDITGDNNEKYEYFVSSLYGSTETVYFFNDANEMKEVVINTLCGSTNEAKNKINQLLKYAKNKYETTGFFENAMHHKNNLENFGYSVELKPFKMSETLYIVTERYLSLSYF